MEIKTAKLKVKLGSVEIDFEGDSDFLRTEVMPTIAQVLSIAKDNPTIIGPTEKDEVHASPETSTKALLRNDGTGSSGVGSLASFIKDRKADSNQVKRFLATARWLQLRGTAEPSSSDVAKALRDNHQARLTNPADCLNKNVAHGFCEKTSNGFFITSEGLAALDARNES